MSLIQVDKLYTVIPDLKDRKCKTLSNGLYRTISHNISFEVIPVGNEKRLSWIYLETEYDLSEAYTSNENCFHVKLSTHWINKISYTTDMRDHYNHTNDIQLFNFVLVNVPFNKTNKAKLKRKIIIKLDEIVRRDKLLYVNNKAYQTKQKPLDNNYLPRSEKYEMELKGLEI